MKTQIALSSFVAANFEVLPLVIQWPPQSASEPVEENLIDWVVRRVRRARPARKLPGACVCFRVAVCRTVRLSQQQIAR
ncbi:MAG: hypothetical protein QM813_17860 [Verrucomicrobiota bacterium]